MVATHAHFIGFRDSLNDSASVAAVSLPLLCAAQAWHCKRAWTLCQEDRVRLGSGILISRILISTCLVAIGRGIREEAAGNLSKELVLCGDFVRNPFLIFTPYACIEIDLLLPV